MSKREISLCLRFDTRYLVYQPVFDLALSVTVVHFVTALANRHLLFHSTTITCNNTRVSFIDFRDWLVRLVFYSPGDINQH